MLNHSVRVLRTVGAMLVVGIATVSVVNAVELPTRTTPRPATTNSVPHVQLDVEPRPEFREALLSRVSGIANVEVRNTVISLPGAKGFWIKDGLPLAHPEAIVGGREFAHVHPDGSLHASLEPATARAAVEAGWAVPHPWARQRPGWEGFVMIYSPLTSGDVDVVFELVKASYAYVTGTALN